MKKIWENIKLVGSMAIIATLLLYIATLAFMPEMTIKFFGFQPYVVMTESMEPVYNVNDGVIATSFNIDNAEVGDVITFKADIDYNGTLEVVTHYIYSIEGSGNDAIIRTHRHFEEGEVVVPDTWLLHPEDVIGSVSFGVKYLGYITGFITSIYGIIVLALNVIIFSFVKYLKNHDDSEVEKEETEKEKLLREIEELKALKAQHQNSISSSI